MVVDRMPGKIGSIAEQIIITAKEILGNKRRLARQEATPHLGKLRETAGQIIIRQKKAGPPDFQQKKNRCGKQEVVPEQRRQDCWPTNLLTGPVCNHLSTLAHPPSGRKC